MSDKLVSADEAVSVIRDGDTVCISGFVGVGTPDELLIALEKRFLDTGHPRDLTLVLPQRRVMAKSVDSTALPIRVW